MRQVGPIGGHEVVGGDAADGERVVVGAGVAHDADALHGQQHGEGLRCAAVKVGGFDFGDDDRVGFAECVEAVARDFAEAADGEAGTGEGVSPDDFFRQAKLQAELADFVFEQVAQRFDEVEAELGREAADVVMELDRVGRAIGRGAAFDDVGVERALGEKLGVCDLQRFGGEAFDERVADDAAFFLRVGDAGEAAEKPAFGFHHVQIGFEVVGELFDDDFSSSFRSRPLSTRMHESCGPMARYSSAATTAESTPPDRPQMTRSLADALANLCDRALGEIAESPGAGAMADVGQEIRQDRFAIGRVRDFGVKLQAVEWAAAMFHGREMAVDRARERR